MASPGVDPPADEDDPVGVARGGVPEHLDVGGQGRDEVVQVAVDAFAHMAVSVYWGASAVACDEDHLRSYEI